MDSISGGLCVSILLGILLLLILSYVLPRPLVVWFASKTPHVFFLVSAPRNSAVALTIDDSPTSQNTEKIASVLKKHGAKATFFCIGEKVLQHDPDKTKLKSLVEDGHELGNHTLTSRASILLSSKQLRKDMAKTHEILSEACSGDSAIRWFRPASGWFTKEIVQIGREFGYRTALASVYPHDPVVPVEFINKWYLLNLHTIQPGDVILVHDRKWTPGLLDQVLPVLKSRGLQIVTLSKLIAQN